MLKIGDVVDGKYRVVERIGAGGMSVVWHARNERSNKMWAIKEVRREGLVNNRVAEMALLAEIDTLKNLRHDNIVAISDVLETPESLLILMDYVEGNPLGMARTEDLQSSDTIPLINGAFPQKDVIRWAEQLAGVFAYLHRQNPPIVYRDLKPSNIMLKPNGDVVLIDFGTARRWAGGQLQSVRGAAGTVALGTYGYAAPEILMGDVHTDRADPRSDIYSLGVTLYHLVTGHNPSQPPYEMYPIRQINPMLSGGLEKIIGKCTQANPEDRYANCEQLLYDLQHYQEVDDGFRKSLRRRVTVFAATAALAAALVGAGVFCSAMEADAREADFAQVLGEARNLPDGSDEQIAAYHRAIDLMPQDTSTYTEMLLAMRGDEDEFTSQDDTTWRDLMARRRDDLQAAPGWPELSYQAGLTYGFFYQGADGDTAAAEAFETAVATADQSADFYPQADLFNQVFGFRARAGQKLGQVDYAEYWESLERMVDSVDVASVQSDVAGLGALLLPTKVLAGYPDRFVNAGVSVSQLDGLLDLIADKSSGVVCKEGTVDPAVKEDCDALPGALEDARAAVARQSAAGPGADSGADSGNNSGGDSGNNSGGNSGGDSTSNSGSEATP
ncbi:MAG: serine/threonine protein kinase [Bifidobacteriaceae bacterium]|jgi:serine/threonine-protein kinase|nr:serine/threonine protein kinase [Bifidobacteriaceae bacterium]